MEADSWYHIHKIDEIDSPALVIYTQRVKENIRRLVSMIDDTNRLRPHAKTHKSKEAALMMMEIGINKFKCATIAEAEMLGMCGAKDVLLAYPPFGPKLQRFVTLIKKYPSTVFSCLADNAASAKRISDITKGQLVIRIFIDLNVGMNRSGIKPGSKAVELYEFCNALDGIEVIGFHVYDGHIKEIDIEKRRIICEEAFAPVRGIISELTGKGYKHPVVVIGGSPSFPIYAGQKNVECSPGTFIFWDKGYMDTLPEQHFLPAALVITRVVSLPDETKLCLDLGYKSVASENVLNKRVYFINAPELKFVSHSEEHLVVEASAHHTWKVGDLLYGIPFHVCPTCALYESAVIVDAGEVTGTWEIIARDRCITV
jgi:D-serine deaminase-like pyridoxal phosphate-dependent protein